ncbi:MAG TPA: hypothetical protein VND45_09730 [Thermoanaerobaculia bacterium]|nr:hypothetical protein [Thermoanaerobaculia bacterium]
MDVTLDRGGQELRERLRDRLSRVDALRCEEHGEPVTAVTIHGRENGWFDARFTTCCEALEKQAATIVRDRV